MSKVKGFTLIELVVVIVILGILAVVAAPKFMNLSTDARISSLEGMQGALAGGTSLINMKAIIDKQTEGAGSIVAGISTITLQNGYPTGFWQSSMRYITGLDNVNYTSGRATICEVEWCGLGNQFSISSGITTTSPVVIGKIYPKGFSFDHECGVYYINNLDGNKPEIALEIADC